MKNGELGRRQILKTAGLASAVAALWKPAMALASGPHPDGDQHADLVFDVACLGDTFAPDVTAALDASAGDLRGAGFVVSGSLYPEGTIEGDGFDPASVPAVGEWLCRGYLIFHPGRPLPHAITTQEYLFGLFGEDGSSPLDTLVSSGIEGGIPTSLRPVIGGSGRYRRAHGHVRQDVLGFNTTVLNVFNLPAPSFRFFFDF